MIHDVISKIGKISMEDMGINHIDEQQILNNLNKLYPIPSKTERLIPIRLYDDGLFIKFDFIGDPISQQEKLDKCFTTLNPCFLLLLNSSFNFSLL